MSLSDSARVMKGDLEMKIPKISFLGLGRMSGSSVSMTGLEDEDSKDGSWEMGGGGV